MWPGVVLASLEEVVAPLEGVVPFLEEVVPFLEEVVPFFEGFVPPLRCWPPLALIQRSPASNHAKEICSELSARCF